MRAAGEIDVVVVGSGASGGWAAKRLAEAGARVVLLDAGRALTDADYSEHQPPFTLRYRDRSSTLLRRTRPRQADCYACMEYNADWFVNDLEEPYTEPEGRPFGWVGRMRVVGGRTNVWGRQSYRLSDLDFKAASHDGYGDDWPLSYADLAPYYDIVEEYIGVSGSAEGAAALPDGRFQPPMAMTCVETQLRTRVAERMGRTVTIGRTANLTRPLNGRAACHYCGPCERGCATHSYFNAAFTTVADALATGRCTLVTHAMAWKVVTPPGSRRATGVLYIDRQTREVREVRARAVVLCAQTLESVRILLNSSTRDHPNGLANSSGVLGHYLMDHHAGNGAVGDFPAYRYRAGLGGPQRPNGIYVVRFRNTGPGTRHPEFLRGYGYQGWESGGLDWRAPGFGAAYKEALRQGQASLTLAGFGEALARRENRVEIDPSGAVDAFGIPILKIHMTWSANERRMMRDMAASAAEMLEAVGAANVREVVEDPTPGFGIHEAGIARMGADPGSAVLNQFCQAHDVRNLFVMDASCFVSIGCQNPTLTIMAIAVRSSDYLLEQLRTGDL